MQSDQGRGTLDIGPNPGRRKLLALVIASTFLPPLAHAASSAATGTAGQRFVALSLFATGRSKLDPQLGTKLFAALRESDASFAGAADLLAADATSGKYPDVESLEAAIRGTPKHGTLLALVSAWYTGTVSVKGKPQVITMGDALMYQPIADGSHIPGNCEGATNSWAQRPYPALADMPKL
jgi:fructose 5-dehydrogenase small subunit